MRVARFLLGGILLLAIIAAAAYLLRKPIAGYAVRSAMASAGLENPAARVVALSFSGIRLENVSAGDDRVKAFQFDAVEVDFEWRRLWSERKTDAVRIGPGELRFKITPDGRVLLPGVNISGGGDGQGKLPFSKLALNEIGFYIDAPEGAAAGVVSVDYDLTSGGRAAFEFSTAHLGYQAVMVEGASITAEALFSEDGTISLHSNLKGDIVTTSAALRSADITLNGKGGSWRDALAGGDKLSFEALIEVSDATLPIDGAPAFSVINRQAALSLIGDPMTSLNTIGALKLHYSNGDIVLQEAPPRSLPILQSDTGVKLSLSAIDGGPLFQWANGRGQAAFSYSLQGAKVDAKGSINAIQQDASWRIKAPVVLGAFHAEALSIEGAALNIDAIANAIGVIAEISGATNIQEASIGRLNIFDTPVAASVELDVNYAARQAVFAQKNECLSFERVKVTVDEQDSEAILSDAVLCSEENEPLATLNWSGPAQCAVSGLLSAANGRYRLGRTRIAGQPPRVSLDAVYKPGINQTKVAGQISGGAMTLNDVLNLSRSEGDFTLSLNKDMLAASVALARVRIAQNLELPRVAPVIGDGELFLRDKKATFDYVLRTPAGERLGAGKGAHNVATARGASRFVFDRLEFLPDGLQPDRLAPVLKGVIGTTIGATTGTADFSWTTGGIASAADLVFEDLTFGGPTRVVTKTIGLNGNIQFAELWPVTTSGPQTITVDGVDLDALQLENGEVIFEMPGDETLKLERATFPWFGGELGVYDATASIAGGEATAPLRVSDVDLSQVFDYVDIDGLSGEGVINGVLPLVVQNGKASIENGVMQAAGPGAIRYTGSTAEQAAAVGEQAQIAFDILRDLRYNSLGVSVNGPLDGRLEFQLDFEGTGEVSVRNAKGRVPVLYRINLDAALLELLNQANLMRDVQLQIQRGLTGDDEAK